MIIEIAGLPGAGKTTLRDLLADRLSSAGLAVVTCHLMRPTTPGLRGAVVRTVGRVAAVLREPAVTAQAVRVLLADPRPAPERWFAFRLLAVTLDNRAWLAQRQVCAVVDEGFVQRAMLLFGGGAGPVPRSAVARYARSVPAPSVVVMLHIEPSEAVQRTAARERGLPPRFARRSGDELTASLEHAAAVLAAVASDLRARGVRVVDVDAGTERWGERLDALVAEILADRPLSAT